MKNKTIIIIATIIVVVLISLLFVIFNKNINKNNQSSYVEKKEKIAYNFESKINEVKDFKYHDYKAIGWVQVSGTNINMPIFTPMLSELENNNELQVDINYAWRSIGYESGENRVAILGHNMLNLSSNPMKSASYLSDFEELMSFVYYDFAKDNLLFQITDEDGCENIYLIYAVSFANYLEEGNSYKKNDLKDYIKDVKKDSIYNYDIDVDENDDLVSLITCTRFFGINENNKFKIDGRKLRKNEELYKYNVVSNDNYNDILEILTK